MSLDRHNVNYVFPPLKTSDAYRLNEFGFRVVYRCLHTPVEILQLKKTVTVNSGLLKTEQRDGPTRSYGPTHSNKFSVADSQGSRYTLHRHLRVTTGFPTMQSPLLVPLFPPGKEPLPPGMTEEDRANMMQVKKYQNYMTAGMESCVGKTTMAAAFGMFALRCFFTYFP